MKRNATTLSRRDGYDDVKLIATDCAACAIRSCAKAKARAILKDVRRPKTCDNMKPYRGDGHHRDKRNAFLRAKNIHATADAVFTATGP